MLDAHAAWLTLPLPVIAGCWLLAADY